MNKIIIMYGIMIALIAINISIFPSLNVFTFMLMLIIIPLVVIIVFNILIFSSEKINHVALILNTVISTALLNIPSVIKNDDIAKVIENSKNILSADVKVSNQSNSPFQLFFSYLILLGITIGISYFGINMRAKKMRKRGEDYGR
ncbi:hypothetical protein HIR68_03180 [Staphylococcus coagulans]|uniref:hypothetical protein n=1 Tax=Staphylococcus TaxID=1279 RepID=UPI0013F418ED|nr:MULTISPECIES: hypothetical protein [Staphylococcus]NHA36562.1 hypothetical protein [Staphylococcus schleiferi]MBT2829770.1 hypothetical protein [Staphylococcus coagulans]MBT2859383.1 hypothetical protein [Staphylococcus coagulans]MBU3872870.1 hypothetical protein [Staphylococcus coagulans]MDR9832671.1 hypothetical protein [Staphylococcus coagulans]